MQIKHQVFRDTFFAALLFFSANPATASLLNYTFEGYIDNFGNDLTGEATNIGLGLHVPVSYTLAVDFSETGYRTISGAIEQYSDTSGSFYGTGYTKDYFYTHIVSSSHQALSPRIYAVLNDYANFNLGVSVSWDNNTAYGDLNVGSTLTIQNQHRIVQNWTIGEHLQGFYQYGDETTGTDNTIRSALTLTNISTPSTPPPSTKWFVALVL